MRAQGEGLRRSPTRLAARQTDRLTDWRTDWLSLSDSSGQLYEYEAYLNIKPNRTEPNRTKSNPNRIRLVLSRVWLNWAALSARCDPWPLWATVLVAPFLIVAFMICQKKLSKDPTESQRSGSRAPFEIPFYPFVFCQVICMRGRCQISENTAQPLPASSSLELGN